MESNIPIWQIVQLVLTIVAVVVVFRLTYRRSFEDSFRRRLRESGYSEREIEDALKSVREKER